MDVFNEERLHTVYVVGDFVVLHLLQNCETRAFSVPPRMAGPLSLPLIGSTWRIILTSCVSTGFQIKVYTLAFETII